MTKLVKSNSRRKSGHRSSESGRCRLFSNILHTHLRLVDLIAWWIRKNGTNL